VKRIAAVATAVALAAGVVVGVGGGDRLGGQPAYALVPPDIPTTSPSPTTSPTPTTQPRQACPTTGRPFVPRTITVRGVTRRARVVAPPRVNGVPGAPPLTSAGKQQFAWDRKWRRPGSRHGNVLLNAHVWPDGSAVGNRLLAKLHRGDRIVVRGRHHRKLCYRVTERIQVYPRQALRRYYKWSGRPQLALVVCSGRRLGPGVWEKRTIWFASPRA
jgi:hypothetical protein